MIPTNIEKTGADGCASVEVRTNEAKEEREQGRKDRRREIRGRASDKLIEKKKFLTNDNFWFIKLQTSVIQDYKYCLCTYK